MLLDKKIRVKMNGRKSFTEHYNSLGYQSKVGEMFLVKQEDLTKSSKIKVEIECDYCHDIITRPYCDYIFHRNKSPIKKDACSKCRGKKTKESNLLVYGCESTAHVPEIREKILKTWTENYGVDHPFKSKKVKDKRNSTMIKRYGVENFFEHENFKELMNEKHGYWHFSQNSEKLKRVVEKRTKTLFHNGTAPCSMQQRYIHEIVGGELNYPIDRLSLDIAFPEEKIYLEYQGSGHNLSIKFDQITQEEFDEREKSRSFYLKRRGWKMIEVISREDFIVRPRKLLEMVTIAREVLKERSYICFDIDESTITYKNNIKVFDFGEKISSHTMRYSNKLGKYEEFIKMISED